MQGPVTERLESGLALAVVYQSIVVRAQVEPEPPHRFVGLVFRPVSEPLSDPRLAEPPWEHTGDAARAVAVLRDEYRSRGLIGVAAAGFAAHSAEPVWAVAGGYAVIETGRAVRVEERLLAGSITKLFTAVTALQLVAEGRIGLDDSANAHLASLRLADDGVTIRHLLTHTGGVSSTFDHYAQRAPDSPADVLGPVVALDFAPGTQRVYSNGGYTVLGEVIAAVSQSPVDDAITARVLDPLGMASSSFARSWPDGVGPGYEEKGGVAVPARSHVPSVVAAGGLCTTVGDLGRFIAGWQTLLPEHLASAAITAQPIEGYEQQGFGWKIGAGSAEPIVGHAGATIAHTSSLLWQPVTGRATVVLTNRRAEAEAINLALLDTLT